MREKQIEQKLVKAVKAAGGLCPKFVSPGMDGMPDRLALLPGGKIAFIEVKAPGKKPRPLQLHHHNQLRQLGFRVFVLDDPKQISDLLKRLLLEESTCEGGWGAIAKPPIQRHETIRSSPIPGLLR